MIPLSPVQNSSLALKAVQVATSRLETALVKATSFVDKDKARMNLRSALALGYMEGLSELLEITSHNGEDYVGHKRLNLVISSG